MWLLVWMILSCQWASGKSGKLVGYDIDLARAVFKLYGIKFSFQSIDWSMNATELNNGTIDLIWNGYSKTPQREEESGL